MTARLFNGEEVLGLLDAEGEDNGLDEIFFLESRLNPDWRVV